MNIRIAAILVLSACGSFPLAGQTLPIVYGQTASLKVDCSHKSPWTYPTINAALKKLNPQGPNTVTVSGTCNDNVLIQGFDRLTLISTTGAIINDASSGGSFVVEIEDSRSATVQGFTVNGGLDGLVCGSASVCYFTGNTVQAAVGQEGVAVSNGSIAYLTNNVIQKNAQRGLTVNEGSQVFSTTDTFQSNGDSGVVANSGAYFSGGNSIIENNANDGVVATDHSTLRLISCIVSGNIGNGVTVQRGSDARFDSYSGPVTVIANSGSGVLVRDLSFGFFGPGGNITGNLGGTDVVCAPQFPATRGALTHVGGGITNCVEP